MNKTVRVAPALLTEDPAELARMLRITAAFTDFAHVDIMDGRFVPTRSITSGDIAAANTHLKWEAHLMVTNPADCLADYQRAGAFKVTFHYEAAAGPAEVAAAARKLGLEVGLAVNPETPLADIMALTGAVDSVLFMSVHPGYYGARFLPEVLDKIREFRKAAPEVFTALDGGVKEENISDIAAAGVNEICVGSAIFRQPDPAASYRRLVALAAA